MKFNWKILECQKNVEYAEREAEIEKFFDYIENGLKSRASKKVVKKYFSEMDDWMYSCALEGAFPFGRSVSSVIRYINGVIEAEAEQDLHYQF